MKFSNGSFSTRMWWTLYLTVLTVHHEKYSEDCKSEKAPRELHQASIERLQILLHMRFLESFNYRFAKKIFFFSPYCDFCMRRSQNKTILDFTARLYLNRVFWLCSSRGACSYLKDSQRREGNNKPLSHQRSRGRTRHYFPARATSPILTESGSLMGPSARGPVRAVRRPEK